MAPPSSVGCWRSLTSAHCLGVFHCVRARLCVLKFMTLCEMQTNTNAPSRGEARVPGIRLCSARLHYAIDDDASCWAIIGVMSDSCLSIKSYTVQHWCLGLCYLVCFVVRTKGCELFRMFVALRRWSLQRNRFARGPLSKFGGGKIR